MHMGVQPVRTAMVGLGYWGPKLLRNLVEIEATEVVWLCDSDPTVLHGMQRRYPGIPASTSFDTLLEDPAVEAVALATPIRTHYELASRALCAGKHVFVEKPLAASTAEAQHLVELAAARELVLMPGHTFLYSPPVNLIKRLIDQGELGDIYFISSSRVNLGLHQKDSSVVWDLGPHDFAILRYWLNAKPERVSAMSRSCIMPTVADVAFVNLLFPSGALAHIELSWLAPGKLRRTAIVGSRRMVVYDDTSIEPVRIFDSGVMPRDSESFGQFRLTYRAGDIISPAIDAREPLSLQMQDFCMAIRNGDTPLSSATLGVEVVQIVEAVEESLREQAEVRVNHNGVPSVPV